MAFVANDGGLYDVHPSDDLMSYGTYEYIDFKMTLPHSYYIFIWRRDKNKITASEAEKLRKYVKWDLDDETEDVFKKYNERFDDELEFPIFEKTLDDNRCIVLVLYEMKLPEGVDNWVEFLDEIKFAIKEKMEFDKDGMKQHDKELKFYDGSFFKSQEYFDLAPE